MAQTIQAVISGKVTRKHRMSRMARLEAIHGYMFISPWLLGVLFFTLGPMLAGLYFSFTRYEILSPPRWVGLDNYAKILGGSDPLVVKSLYNTLYYVAFSVPLGLIAGFSMALLLNQKLVGIAFFRTSFYMPSIVPTVASVALWMWLLHGRFGLINMALALIGVRGPAWLTDPNWTKPALILWSLWGVGGGMIIYLAGLQSISDQLYEAAAIDGAGPWRKFWNVTLPMMTPTIFFNLIMGIIGSFQVFTPALLMGGTSTWTPAGGPLDSLLFYVLYLYQNGFQFLKMGYAAALAWILFLIIMIFTLIQFRTSGRWVYYEAEVE